MLLLLLLVLPFCCYSHFRSTNDEDYDDEDYDDDYLEEEFPEENLEAQLLAMILRNITRNSSHFNITFVTPTDEFTIETLSAPPQAVERQQFYWENSVETSAASVQSDQSAPAAVAAVSVSITTSDSTSQTPAGDRPVSPETTSTARGIPNPNPNPR